MQINQEESPPKEQKLQLNLEDLGNPNILETLEESLPQKDESENEEEKE